MGLLIHSELSAALAFNLFYRTLLSFIAAVKSHYCNTAYPLSFSFTTLGFFQRNKRFIAEIIMARMKGNCSFKHLPSSYKNRQILNNNV